MPKTKKTKSSSTTTTPVSTPMQAASLVEGASPALQEPLIDPIGVVSGYMAPKVLTALRPVAEAGLANIPALPKIEMPRFPSAKQLEEAANPETLIDDFYQSMAHYDATIKAHHEAIAEWAKTGGYSPTIAGKIRKKLDTVRGAYEDIRETLMGEAAVPTITEHAAGKAAQAISLVSPRSFNRGGQTR